MKQINSENTSDEEKSEQLSKSENEKSDSSGKVSSEGKKLLRKVETYQKITHKQRIDVIYSHQIHALKLREISELHNIKYNTVRNILSIFNKHGRTNRKLYNKKHENTLFKTEKVVNDQNFNKNKELQDVTIKKQMDGKNQSSEMNGQQYEKNLLIKKNKRKQIIIDEPNKNRLYLYVDQEDQYDQMMMGSKEFVLQNAKEKFKVFDNLNSFYPYQVGKNKNGFDVEIVENDFDEQGQQFEKDFVFVKHFKFLNGYQKGKVPFFNLSLPFMIGQTAFDEQFKK